jgi:hypothetical protein
MTERTAHEALRESSAIAKAIEEMRAGTALAKRKAPFPGPFSSG